MERMQQVCALALFSGLRLSPVSLRLSRRQCRRCNRPLRPPARQPRALASSPATARPRSAANAVREAQGGHHVRSPATASHYARAWNVAPGTFPRIVRFTHWVRELVRRQPQRTIIFWLKRGVLSLAASTPNSATFRTQPTT
jgi:hypothetical protein